MDNLPTFYGNLVSEQADQRMDLVGIGQLLALSSIHEENALAALRYRHEFGAGNIYSLQTKITTTTDGEENTKIARPRVGHLAFGEAISFDNLSTLIDEGATIRGTKLSDEFGIDEYNEKYSQAVPLFAISPRGKLHVYSADIGVTPASGWTLISLIEGSEEEANGH
jgi:hypothetical protein